jgi:acyl-ACP thioesterase
MPDLSVHSETLVVKSYEVDFRNRWKAHCLQQALQEAASNHATELGWGYPEMRERGLAWVLSRMRIDFHDMPLMRDSVSVRTWHKGVQQRLFFTRDFMLSAQGRPVAEASFAWLLVDWTRRRMLPPSALPGALLEHHEDAIPDLLEKIVVPEGLPVLASFQVGYSAVDPVGHANSARYVEWLTDCFPFESYSQRRLRRLQVNFSSEIRPEEHVELSAGELEGRWLAQANIRESGKRAFEAQFTWQEIAEPEKVSANP